MSAIDVLSVTPTYSWPIPNPDDPDDVPTDLSELAVAIENTVKGGALIPKPAVNGQFVKGAGGLPVWSALTAADVPLIASATPPASPVDGQEWSLVVDATNGIVWTFRYRAASPSAYKWEFVGGPPLVGMQLAALGNGGTLGTAVNVVASTIALPRSGDYLIGASGRLQGGATVSNMTTGIYVGSVLTLLNPSAASSLPAGGYGGSFAVPRFRYNGGTAGAGIGVFGSSDAANCSWLQFGWEITPARVA